MKRYYKFYRKGKYVKEGRYTLEEVSHMCTHEDLVSMMSE